MWASQGGRLLSPEEIATQVEGADVQGITVLGGEPFEQAQPLARLAALVRDQGRSVMVFTGHRLEDLERSAVSGVAALLSQTDLLVDGPYVSGRPETRRPWVGSTNQKIHFLTNRYRHLEGKLSTLADRIELRVAPTGEVELNGWATVAQLDDLLAGVTPKLGRGRVS